MPKICYQEKRFRESSYYLISIADRICREYARKGFDLTLRQLYYQFVARDIIPNTERSYKRLGSVLNDARLAGLLDWDHMVDRTRNLRAIYHYHEPADIIADASSDYAIDKWAGQDNRVEVWVEKEALAGVVEKICHRLDVPFFACRGYVSQSEMWRASERLESYNCAEVIILHLGDHDPSGVDMTRDISARLELFASSARVIRIALNMNQVEEYNPPPNPAKITDSRCEGYIKRYGNSSWELDSLDPELLMDLIRENVNQFRDIDLFNKRKDLEAAHVELLRKVSDRWDDISRLLES